MRRIETRQGFIFDVRHNAPIVDPVSPERDCVGRCESAWVVHCSDARRNRVMRRALPVERPQVLHHPCVELNPPTKIARYLLRRMGAGLPASVVHQALFGQVQSLELVRVQGNRLPSEECPGTPGRSGESLKTLFDIGRVGSQALVSAGQGWET